VQQSAPVVAAAVVAKKVSFNVQGEQPKKKKESDSPPPPSAGTRAAKAAKPGRQGGGIRISVSEVTDQGEIVTQDHIPVSMKKRKQPCSRKGLVLQMQVRPRQRTRPYRRRFDPMRVGFENTGRAMSAAASKPKTTCSRIRHNGFADAKPCPRSVVSNHVGIAFGN
jgi:hypothetical protein